MRKLSYISYFYLNLWFIWCNYYFDRYQISEKMYIFLAFSFYISIFLILEWAYIFCCLLKMFLLNNSLWVKINLLYFIYHHILGLMFLYNLMTGYFLENKKIKAFDFLYFARTYYDYFSFNHWMKLFWYRFSHFFIGSFNLNNNLSYLI
jgi:hypothetical protein